jgi:ribose transport system substrate-binding protein
MRLFLSTSRLAWAGLFVLLAAAAGCTDGITGRAGDTGNAGRPAGSGPAGKTGGAVDAPANVKRVVILTNGNSPFWDAGRAGMMEGEKKFDFAGAGLQAVFEVNDGKDSGQISKLRQYASQDDIAAVGISVNTAGNEAIVEELRNLQKKGVKIITLDSDVDRKKHRDARFAFIGTDNYLGGQELGKCARGLRPEGGEYVTFVGITGAQNAIERVGGFGKGAGDKFKSDDNMGDKNDRTQARQNVRDALTNHPEVSTLVGIWSYNAPAIVDVVREKNVRDKVKVVVFDAEPAAIEEMGNGMIDAMVVQNPYEMGYQGARLMKALVKDDQATIKEMFPNHGKEEGDLYDTGIKVVVPNRGSPLKKEMFDAKTTFLKLGDFRDWLKKYNLTGS